MSWIARPAFGSWGDLPIAQVRARLRDELPELVERDERIQWYDMTEYTLQSIIFEHASWCLGRRWRVLVEDFIPHTDFRADLVIERLTHAGEEDLSCGVTAIEVKPRGGLKTLKDDVEKLKRYIRGTRTDVNQGLLFYLSPRSVGEESIQKLIGPTYASKVFLRHLRRD